MKAIFFSRHGGPEVLEYGDTPDPVAGPGELVVDVHAASVNAADAKLRGGGCGALAQFPCVPGRDFSLARPGGRAAFIASGNSAPPSPRPDVRSLRWMAGRDRAHLGRLVALVLAVR